jgi:hypothetical protein
MNKIKEMTGALMEVRFFFNDIIGILDCKICKSVIDMEKQIKKHVKYNTNLCEHIYLCK